MLRPLLPPALAMLILLGGCEVKVGDGAREGEARATGAAAASAEGKSEEGRLSIDAPGFDMKLDIPASLQADVGSESDLLYPGSKLGGLHVQAGVDQGKGDGSVEMRFSTSDAPDKVLAWYRDPARASKLTITSAGREGNGYRISGTSKDGADPFTIRLAAKAGGGTEGRLTLQDRGAR